MPKRYPPEFRRKVLDLVASGRRVAQVAADLDISDQTIYTWRRQELVDTGRLPGTTSADNTEPVDRDFARAAPNTLWVTDITEHPTRECKVYCAVVLDVHSRRVVGWSPQ